MENRDWPLVRSGKTHSDAVDAGYAFDDAFADEKALPIRGGPKDVAASDFFVEASLLASTRR